MSNLVLGIKPGEIIHIGNDIRIEVVKGGYTNGFVRLKISAPKDVQILRDSLLKKRDG